MDSSVFNLVITQTRILKLVYIGNISRTLLFQHLLLHSSFARCLAIRDVTQVCFTRRLSGIDGKLSLTFFERYNLNFFLKSNFYNWKFEKFKNFLFYRKDGSFEHLKVSTISDRAWL